MYRQKNWIRDDMVLRLRYQRCEYTRYLLRAIERCQYTNTLARCNATQQLQYYLQSTTFTRMRDRCRLTGRSHYVVHYANISRFMIQLYSGYGFIGGIRRVGQ